MGEEYRNKDLEGMLEALNKVINTPSKYNASKIVNNKSENSSGEMEFGEPYVKDGKKYFRFYDNVREGFSNKEIEFLKQFLIDKGYEFE